MTKAQARLAVDALLSFTGTQVFCTMGDGDDCACAAMRIINCTPFGTLAAVDATLRQRTGYYVPEMNDEGGMNFPDIAGIIAAEAGIRAVPR